MSNYNLGEKAFKFAKVIWEREPISTRDLIDVCEKVLLWKRTTTYTMLKSLCEKGIFKMENSIVTSLISEEEFGIRRGEEVIEENFSGSLPKFIAAFTKEKSLSDDDIEELRNLIDKYTEE